MAFVPIRTSSPISPKVRECPFQLTIETTFSCQVILRLYDQQTKFLKDLSFSASKTKTFEVKPPKDTWIVMAYLKSEDKELDKGIWTLPSFTQIKIKV